MSMRTVLVVILALVCGITAAIGVGAVMRPVQAATVETVPVVVAVADVGPYMTLTPLQIKVKELPKDSVPEGAITSIEDALERPLRQPIFKGDLILDKKLAAKGSPQGIVTAIPESGGMRAVTILTQNLAAGVAGFVLPGSYVDVLLTLTTPTGPNDPSGGAKTFVLLDNVMVLAVMQYVSAPDQNQAKVPAGEVQCVTLLVTEDQAKMVGLAQNKGGVLQLVLRNPNDKSPASHRTLTIADLEPESARVKPKVEEVAAPVKVEKVEEPEPPAPGQIRIYRGLNESTVQVGYIAPAKTEGPGDVFQALFGEILKGKQKK
jgi:pilus assembly protein CpaB